MRPPKIPAAVASPGKSGRGVSLTNSREVFALLLVITIGAMVRFYHIGGLSLWRDEGFSEWASRQSTWYLWAVLPTFETNPPLYYTFLKGWRVLFGDSEAALRSLSALFGIVTIPFVFAMGRMLGNRRSEWVSGFLAAAMFALSPIHVQYAQEARAYSMLALGVAIAMTGTMWMMLNRKEVCALAAGQPYPRKGRISQMLGLFALGMALIMWSHDTGAFAVLGIALPVVYWWFVDAKRCPQALIRLLIASGVAFTLFLPYLMPLLSLMGKVGSSFWIQVPNLWVIRTTIVSLIGGASKEYVTFVICALAALAITSLWRREMRSIAILLVSVGLVPVLAELLVSLLAMPIFLERTLIYVNIPLYIAVGYGISRVRVANLVVAGAGAVIVVALFGTPLQGYFRDHKKESWNEIATYFSHNLQPGQPVMLSPVSASPALGYYAVQQDATFRMVGLPENWPEPSHSLPAPDAVPGRQKIELSDMGRVSQLIQDNQKVGLILLRSDRYDPESLTIVEILKTHAITDTRKIGGITVIIFSASENNDDGLKK